MATYLNGVAQQTLLIGTRGMSALGHKRTFAMQNVMSALPSKADMGIAGSLMFAGRCGGTLNPFKIITHRINNLAPKFDGDGLRPLSNVGQAFERCLIQFHIFFAIHPSMRKAQDCG